MTDDGPIRVLRVIARMNVGGPAWQASVLTRCLGEYGIETRLLVGQVGPGEASFLKLREPELPVTPVAGLGRSVRLLGDLRALRGVVREIRRFRPHVIHTHTAKAGVVGRVAAILTRVPVRVHTFHGHVLHGYFSKPVTYFVRTIEKVLARRTTALVAVGERVRDELVAAGIGTEGQFIPIAPGVADPGVVDPEEARRILGLPGAQPVVLFVGRITAVKRVDRLLSAFEIVLEDIPEAVLAIAGDGDQTEWLRRSSAAFGDSVHFLGWRADIGTLYSAADLVVISSDNEGMPVTLIEAAMAGVPGVTTDVGSASEVVEHEVTGLVVDVDADSLAAGIIGLLKDGDRRASLGCAAAERALDRFGASRLVSDHVQMYRRLLKH